MNPFVLAQDIHVGTEIVRGPLDPSLQTIGDVINRVVSFIFPVGVLILFVVFVMGGFDYMTSQGNPEKIKSGQAKIKTGIIGFLILVFAFLIVRILAFIFGLTTGII